MRSTFWSLLSQGLQVGLGILSFALLSPWLSPEEFGRFGVAATATGLLGVIGDSGVGAALIRRANLDDATLASAFWLSHLGALLLTAVCAAAAPLLGWLFSDSEVTLLALAMAGIFLASAPGRVSSACLTKTLRFRTLAWTGTIASALGLAAALVAASSGAGPWSLVVMTLGTAAAGACFTYAARPTPVAPALFDRAIARELASFGSQMSGFSLALTLSRFLDGILLGRFLGQGAVGLMTMAQKLTMLPVQRLAGGVGAVFLPTVVQLDEPAARGHAFARAGGTMMLAVAPFCFGVFAIADEIVALLPPRWSDLSAALQVFALTALFDPLGLLSVSIATADGHGKGLLRAALWIMPMCWGTALLGVWSDNPLWFYILWGAASGGGGLLIFLVARRTLRLDQSFATELLWPVGIAAVMAAAVRIVVWLTDTGGTRTGFVLGAATGVALYTCLSWLLRRDAILRVFRLFKQLRHS